MRVTLQPQASVLQYSIKLGQLNGVPSGRVAIPAAGQAWHVAGYSCNDQRQLEQVRVRSRCRQAIIKPCTPGCQQVQLCCAQNNTTSASCVTLCTGCCPASHSVRACLQTGTAAWQQLRRVHAGEPLHLLLGTGDQLYNDNIWGVDCCKQWVRIRPREKMRATLFTDREVAEIRANLLLCTKCNVVSWVVAKRPNVICTEFRGSQVHSAHACHRFIGAQLICDEQHLCSQVCRVYRDVLLWCILALDQVPPA